MPRFSESFRRFVRENITSVEQGRILIILSANPGRSWTIESLSTDLASSPNSIGLRLRALLARRLIVGNDTTGFRYAPHERHDIAVKEFADQFEHRPVSVIALIYSGSSGLESFSNAFRIGGDDHDDS